MAVSVSTRPRKEADFGCVALAGHATHSGGSWWLYCHSYARGQALVMGIALHPYLMGQPYRLRHLRRALEHIATVRDSGGLWFTTPGAICRHVEAMAASDPGALA